MTYSYVLSPQAGRDLGEIWDYTYAAWGMDKADAYLNEIRAALLTLCDSPLLGRDCGSTRAEYRKFPVGSHLLFYRLRANHIDVIRILHRRMDIDRHL
jgi:toxin ParE1/3/4